MGGQNRSQVLVTGMEAVLSRRISDILRQQDIDVHRTQLNASALELVQSTPFDVIVMGFPVTDEAISEFLETARSSGAACRRAGLILVAESERIQDARGLLGKGANRVVTTAGLESDLLSAVEELSRPAPRLLVRAPAQIKLYSDGRPLRVIAQIENLSTSGMLLRGVTQFPVGTAFEVRDNHPGRSRPDLWHRGNHPSHGPEPRIGKGHRREVRVALRIGQDTARQVYRE